MNKLHLPAIPKLAGPYDLSTEEYREYDMPGRVYRIDSPIALYVGTTTHRVVTADGVVHVTPNPSTTNVILRWKNKGVETGELPVNF